MVGAVVSYAGPSCWHQGSGSMRCLRCDGTPPPLPTSLSVVLSCQPSGDGSQSEEPVRQPWPVPDPQFCPRYLDNIHLHPEEEKYQKIKLQNKVFQVRAVLRFLAYVASVVGLPVTQGRLAVGPVGVLLQRFQVEIGRGSRWRGGFMNIAHPPYLYLICMPHHPWHVLTFL